MTGSYDPELNLLYWGTGNPNPDYYGADRKGDNLYTNSLVALDAATGTPEVALPVHAARHPRLGFESRARARRLTIGGVARKVVMVANRNGFFYVLDRAHRRAACRRSRSPTRPGRARSARTAVRSSSTTAARAVCRINGAGPTSTRRPSIPRSGLFFVTARETCATYAPQEPKIVPGQASIGGAVRVDREGPITARCARSTRRPANAAGSSATPRRPWRACSRRRQGWSSPATTRATSWPSTRAPASNLWRYQTGNGDLGRGADDLHARRPPARPYSRRNDAGGLRSASSVGRA